MSACNDTTGKIYDGIVAFYLDRCFFPGLK